MSLDTSFEDHYIGAFEIARNKLPDTISLKQAKSAIRKFIARTDPRFQELSVSERRRQASRQNSRGTPDIVIFIARKDE